MQDNLLTEPMDAKTFVKTLDTETERLEKGGTPEGKVVAEIIRQLTDIEIEAGGPYSFGEAPDLTTNLAIANFLSACGVRLPKLDAYIEKAWRSGQRTSLELRYRTRIAEHVRSEHDTHEPARLSQGEMRMLKKIHAYAKKRLRTLAPELRESTERVIGRVMKGEGKQIPLMPYYVREAFGGKGLDFDDTYLARAGFASVAFWMATIVYDDFWDEDEAAEPVLLPAANLLSRTYAEYFRTLLPTASGFGRFFHDYMDKVDAANTWEISRCRGRVADGVFYLPERLPDYKDFSIKFYPAAGHVFGPVAMLVQLGYSLRSREVKNLIAYFRHYLVAMQLNDDAHDWKEDLGRGHISTAVSLILKEWHKTHPKKKEIHLTDDMEELEQIFWFKVLTPLAKSALLHTARSRRALHALTVLEDAAPLERYIIRNENIAQKALDERAKSDELVRAFA